MSASVLPRGNFFLVTKRVEFGFTRLFDTINQFLTKFQPDYDGPEMQIEREIIPWPKVIRENGLDDLKTTIVNDVIMSSDGRFIVAATNNNLLLILK